MTRGSAAGARIALLACLLGPVAGHGYLFQTVSGSRGPVREHWEPAGRGIPFVLDEAGSDDLARTTVYEALRAGFRTWARVPRARIRFTDEGTTSALDPTPSDGRNLVLFDETGAWLGAPAGTGIIAITRVSADTRTGVIRDADILFNGRDYHFGVDRQAGRVELGDVATHEIGHLLGLDHTPLTDAAERRPTMSPFYSADGPGEARSLEADDRAGASVLYPADGFGAVTAGVAGTVADTSGAPLVGVQVVAEAADTGERVGTVSGAEGEDPGAYRIEGLVPGTYRLLLAPIGPHLSPANFGGRFDPFPAGFPPEYYDNAVRRDLAAQLPLEGGRTLTGIDFVTGLRRPGYPYVEPVFLPNNTPDPEGPYRVRLRAAGAYAVALRYRGASGGTVVSRPMLPVATDEYEGFIPGQRADTRVEYQARAEGPSGQATTFPAAGRWLGFEVVRLSGSPLVFAALREEAAVAVLDAEDHRDLARIAVGDEPIQVLLSPDGATLYVSCLASGEVVRIAAATLQVLDRIRVGDQPLDLATDGRSLYVANSGSGSLSVIDLAQGTARVLPVAGITSGPYGVAVAGASLFVSDLEAAVVLALDPQGAVTARIPVAEQPRSLALGPDGTSLYVTSFSTGAITVVDVAARRVSRTLELPLRGTFAAAASPDGTKLYVTGHADSALAVVDLASGALVRRVRVDADPRGLCLSPTGTGLYVTSAASGRTAVVDVASDEVVGTFLAGPGARGLAVAASPRPADTGEGPANGPLPGVATLAPAFPNPFNGSARITYALPVETWTELGIYDALGQQVRRLVSGRQGPGTYAVAWSGADVTGRPLASGVYLVVLRTPGHRAVQKLALLR